MNSQALQRTNHSRRICLNAGREIALWILGIRNPQAASCIHEANVMAVMPEAAHQRRYALHGLTKRSDVGDLRTDMDADSGSFQVA